MIDAIGLTAPRPPGSIAVNSTGSKKAGIRRPFLLWGAYMRWLVWILAVGPLTAALADVSTPCAVSQIVRGPSDGLWLNCSGLPARLNPNESISVFAVTTVAVMSMAFDSDGTLWFASGGDLYRLDTNGVATETALPNTVVTAPAITADGAGNLFMLGSVSAHPAILRVTRGVLTGTFPIPSSFLDLQDVVVGPDGALWFTRTAAVGRMTMSGVFSSIALPLNGSTLHIVNGGDGNLWASSNNGTLFRITPAGVVTQFAIPAVALAAAANRVWFTTDDGYGWIDVNTLDVQRFKHTNQVGGVPLQRPAIVVLANGDAWFSEYRFPIPSPCPPVDGIPGQPPPPPCNPPPPPPPDLRLVHFTAGGIVVGIPMLSPVALALLSLAFVAIAIHRLLWR